jgi:Transmembrane secretion effector
LSADLTTAAAPTAPAPSRWGPFSRLAFTVIWTTSLVSNVGTAMFDTASGWLITSLDANPITVSLVQVAVSLPLFLFTLPSGALADVIDSRRLLIAAEVAILAVSVVFAGLHQHRYRRPPCRRSESASDGNSPPWKGCRSPISWPRRVLAIPMTWRWKIQTGVGRISTARPPPMASPSISGAPPGRRRRLLSKCDPIGEWQLSKDDNRTASIRCGIRTSLRNELLVGHPQQHGVCAQAEGRLGTGAIAYLDAWGLGLNILFSLAGGAEVADGRLSALSDVGVRALRTIALAA